MPQKLARQEREELQRLLQGAFGEQEVQTLLAVLERVALRGGSRSVRQDLQELQSLATQLVEGQQGLQAALEHLAQAQARTEERVGRLEVALEHLAQAQARTEERVGRLEVALEHLAQAQARTEERVGRLEVALEHLAQAQARTEERVGRLEVALEHLAQAQARTEARVDELAQAQARTERALQDLTRQVGGLSETVGGDIEDIAYIVLHDVLKREFGWQIGVLERSWQQWNGQPVEINVFGQAIDPGPPQRSIWIVGEAKHNLTLREVERFALQVEQAKAHLTGEIFAVCFCYRARPEVRARLQELGIRLVFSYGRLV
jgi:tetratricopeptide (TPR) repeat protein